jgi:acyl-coenzyme A thioesterase PaaI-like protein
MPALDPKAEARCRASFARQQAMTTIGATVETIAPGEVELAMPFSEKPDPAARLHPRRRGHDTMRYRVRLSLMPEDAAVLTTEFKINLLAPAQGERFIASGSVVRRASG